MQSTSSGKAKLAIMLTIMGATLIIGPHILAHYGYMSELKDNVWIIQAIIVTGVFFNSGFGFLVTNEFKFDEFGFQLCLLVLGGTLACLALQLTSDMDMFLGLNDISFLKFASSFGVSEKAQHILLLFILFVLALLGTLFSSIAIKGEDSALGSLFSAVCGTFLLSIYMLALIAKGNL